ncbi:uncharacterized protein [Palaemon carinicauda]|uniref:uncharacterized protein isoform X1 n=1 Tax=Palaemon carinicauda TaxID=392227 RepID=UPI0035B69F49
MIRSMAALSKKFIGQGSDERDDNLADIPSEHTAHTRMVTQVEQICRSPVKLPEYGSLYSIMQHQPLHPQCHSLQNQDLSNVITHGKMQTQSIPVSQSLTYQKYAAPLVNSVHLPQNLDVIYDASASGVVYAAESDFEIPASGANIDKSDFNYNKCEIAGGSQMLHSDLENEALVIKEGNNWKRNIRKKQKNLGKSYTKKNGKVVPAKEFKVVNKCCSVGCFQSVSESDQRNGFTSYWSLGEWSMQTKFLWDHVQIKDTARKTVDGKSRRIHSRYFYIPSQKGEKIKVCKRMFLNLLQISNGRLSYTLSQKVPDSSEVVLKDKRGLNTPPNKTPLECIQEADEFIHLLPYCKVNSENGKVIFSVPQGITIRKVYSLYQRSLTEKGKSPVSLKVFRKLLPEIRKSDALSLPLPLVPYHQYKKKSSAGSLSGPSEKRQDDFSHCFQNTVSSFSARNNQMLQIYPCQSSSQVRPQDSSYIVAGGESYSHKIPSPVSQSTTQVSQVRPSQDTSYICGGAESYSHRIPSPVSQSTSQVRPSQDTSCIVGGESYPHRIPSPVSHDDMSGGYFENQEHFQEITNACFQEEDHVSFQHEESSSGISNQLQDASKHDFCPLLSQQNPKNDFKEKKVLSHSVRKQLRNEGKTYTTPTGKVIERKEFVPQYSCCFRKCYQLISLKQQELLFKSYWAIGSWNLQTKFLWDHIEVHSTRSKTVKEKDSRRALTRDFYLSTHDGKRSKVCKVLFCTTLQISNGRLTRAVNLKINSSSPPQDKRGKNSPGNKASSEDVEFMMYHVCQLLKRCSNQAKRLQKFILPPNMTLKAAHESYKTACTQQNKKPLCYTLFSQAFHKEVEVPSGVS